MKAKRKKYQKINLKKNHWSWYLFSQTKPDWSLEFVPGHDDDDNLVCLLFAPHVMRHERSELRGFSPDFYNETTR